MLEHLRAPFKRLIEPFAKALVSLGLTANAVTVIGAIGTIVVAFATGITGWLFAGAVVLTLLVLADSLDGSIAALTTGGTQFGAFLDSTLDRIADWALLAGVVIFFILHADWWYDINRSSSDCISWIGIAAAMVSMMTSFVTSYARARAESVGFEVKTALQRVPTDWSSFWWAWRLPGSRTKGYGWPSPWYCLRFWDSLPYSNAFLRLVARWPSVIRRISCEPAA
mgnify:CR=1 FL=1